MASHHVNAQRFKTACHEGNSNASLTLVRSLTRTAQLSRAPGKKVCNLLSHIQAVLNHSVHCRLTASHYSLIESFLVIVQSVNAAFDLRRWRALFEFEFARIHHWSNAGKRFRPHVLTTVFYAWKENLEQVPLQLVPLGQIDFTGVTTVTRLHNITSRVFHPFFW